MTNFYACVTYYSLPSFPKSCIIIRNHNILPRDVLLCNRTNDHHIRGGMQYDPNIENAEYRVCEPPVRQGLRTRAGKYDDLYLMFRTRNIRVDGTSSYLVTGFYKIKKEFDKTQREAPIIYADAMQFVSISDCIDITERITESQAFRCCLTSENPKWMKDLVQWADQLEKATNQTEVYIREINRLKRIFRENEFRDTPYPMCTPCKHSNASTSSCPLVWRRHHRTIPNHPANYMRNLDEYFESFTSDERKPVT